MALHHRGPNRVVFEDGDGDRTEFRRYPDGTYSVSITTGPDYCGDRETLLAELSPEDIAELTDWTTP